MRIIKKWLKMAAVAGVALSMFAGAMTLDVRAGEDQLQYDEQATSQEQNAEPPKFMQAFTSDDELYVKAYIRNGSWGGGINYQIAQSVCDEIYAFSIAEDPKPMRTLILVDNSESIPANVRGTIKEAINKIIDARVNNESFKIATFSEGVSYLTGEFEDNVTTLHSVVEAIEYHDQETYLTDVLYDLIREIDEEGYNGYTRLIIFSDGVDNKEEGVTRGELNDLMESRNYPIYTFGVKTKNNADWLKNMYALSRITGCESAAVETDNADEIAGIVAADSAIMVMNCRIPDDIKDGGEKNSKLMLPDGSVLQFKVKMPFMPKENEDELNSNDSSEAASASSSDNEGTTEEGIKDEPVDITKIVIGSVIGGVCFLLIVVFLIYNIAFKKNKKKEEEPALPTETLGSTASETELFGYGSGSQNNGTEQLTPSLSDGRKKYMFLLTDNDDEDRSFRCELVDEITIGRQEDNHVIIGDDNSVHRHHSIVSVKNGTFYYTDLKDVKNRSSINGVLLKPTIPQLIVTNTVVTIGRHTYTIRITEGR